MVFICIFAVTVSSEAAENKGIYLSPPFIDVEISGSDSEKQLVLEIGNQGIVSETLELSVVDFGSLNESGGVAFLTTDKQPGDRKYALASWISLEKSAVTINPGEKQEVKVTIINKESLMSGGHYGAVLATVKFGGTNNVDTVGLSKSLATLFYVLKTGGERRNLIFKNIEWSSNWFRLPYQIKLRFENNGNVHVVPRGKIEITNPRGELVTKGIINEGSGKIMPESFRIFPVTIKPTRGWMWPGKYTIRVDYRYDGKDNFLTYQNNYIYIGREGIILVIVGFVFIGFLLLIKRRKYRQ
jgi:hypothetical protein